MKIKNETPFKPGLLLSISPQTPFFSLSGLSRSPWPLIRWGSFFLFSLGGQIGLNTQRPTGRRTKGVGKKSFISTNLSWVLTLNLSLIVWHLFSLSLPSWHWKQQKLGGRVVNDLSLLILSLKNGRIIFYQMALTEDLKWCEVTFVLDLSASCRSAASGISECNSLRLLPDPFYSFQNSIVLECEIHR